nr:hypothetical protein [Candidatus Freyarchaeota archaeon]
MDDSLGGGILSNSVVLIAHQTGFRQTDFVNWKLPVSSGKEFFVILVDYTMPVEDLYYTSGILEFKGEVKNDRVFISIDRVRVINCFSSEVGNEKYLFDDKVYTLDEPFNTDKLFSVMRTARESLPENAWVVWVFLSLTDLAIGVSEPEIAKFFRRASRLHKQYGDLAFYLLNMDAHTKLLAMISQLVDVIINFKIVETEEKLRNYIQVVKSPFPIDTKRLYYDVNTKGDIIYY